MSNGKPSSDSIIMDTGQVTDQVSINYLKKEIEDLRHELLEERRLRISLEKENEDLRKKKLKQKKNTNIQSPTKLKTPTNLSPINIENNLSDLATNTSQISAHKVVEKPPVKRLRPNSPEVPDTSAIVRSIEPVTIQQTVEIKKESIPPIVLNKPSDFKAARQTLLNNGLLFTSVQKQNNVKIIAPTIELFRKITKVLDERKFSFFSYTLPEDKPLRVIIRGLNSNFTIDEIKEELTLLNFDVLHVHQLINKTTNQPMLLFAISLKKSEQNKNIYNLTHLLHQKVSIETQNKPKNTLQCHRCQVFGHAAVNCRAAPVCVKCAGPHVALECPHGNKTDNPLCGNCGGKHPASYGGCIKNPNNKKSEFYKTKTSKQEDNIKYRKTYSQSLNSEISTTQTVLIEPVKNTPAPLHDINIVKTIIEMQQQIQALITKHLININQ